MVYVFLADGFEETEAVVPIDLLRRAGIRVRTVGVNTTTPTGSHGMTIMSDISDETLFPDDIDAIVLPGGMPGTTNLENSETVKRAVRLASERDVTVAAICAAPVILAHAGLLEGHRATVFPSYAKELGGSYADEDVIYDAPFLTARAAGSAVDFALKLIEILRDEKTSRKTASDIYYK